MSAFIHAECPCGRTLRARPDQAGTVICCWDCGGAVTVPVPARTARLVRAMADAAFDTLRLGTGVVIVAGAMLITTALLVPRAGLGLAAGLIAAASFWGYGGQVRPVGSAPAPAAGGSDALRPAQVGESGPRRLGALVARVSLACAAPVALAGPFLVRNRGHALPPPVSAPNARELMALAFVGWLLLPVALAAVNGHGRHGRLPPRQVLAALARHPLATLSALLVVPLGLLATEGLTAGLAWEQGQLPLLVADLFPPPRLEQMVDGAHLFFLYDGTAVVVNCADSLDTLIPVYGLGLRRGFTLTGTIPPSLSIGLFQVRQELWMYRVLPGHYLALRIALTVLILAIAGALLKVQARWLGLIVASGALTQPFR